MFRHFCCKIYTITYIWNKCLDWKKHHKTEYKVWKVFNTNTFIIIIKKTKFIPLHDTINKYLSSIRLRIKYWHIKENFLVCSFLKSYNVFSFLLSITFLIWNSFISQYFNRKKLSENASQYFYWKYLFIFFLNRASIH